MTNGQKEPVLAACPFCGMLPVVWEVRGNWQVACRNEECSMRRVLSLGKPTEAETIAAWNRRYVCDDKNGKSVYAGDKVIYEWCNWKNKFTQCYVTELRPPFYGYGLTDADDNDFTAEGFHSREIELVESKASND